MAPIGIGWAADWGPAKLTNLRAVPAPPLVETNLRFNLLGNSAPVGGVWPDSSGNNVSASLINTPTHTGTSYVLNGVDQRVYLTTWYGSQLQTATIEIWLKNTEVNAGHTYFSQGFYGDIALGTGQSNNVLAIQDQQYRTPVFTNTTNDGNWHQLAYTISSQFVTIYVDGVSLGTVTFLGWPSGGLLSIGANRGGTQYTSMEVGEARGYIANLSSADILQNFNARKGDYGL